MYGELVSRWSGEVRVAVVSPLEFYDRVWTLLSETEFPGISATTVTHREGGWLSARRIYLRIRHKTLFFDVCAFPIGASLVVSWWLHRDPPGVVDLLAELPILGYFLKRTVKAATYTDVDKNEAFQRRVADAVRRVIDELAEQGGPDFGIDGHFFWDGID